MALDTTINLLISGGIFLVGYIMGAYIHSSPKVEIKKRKYERKNNPPSRKPRIILLDEEHLAKKEEENDRLRDRD